MWTIKRSFTKEPVLPFLNKKGLLCFTWWNSPQSRKPHCSSSEGFSPFLQAAFLLEADGSAKPQRDHPGPTWGRNECWRSWPRSRLPPSWHLHEPQSGPCKTCFVFFTKARGWNNSLVPGFSKVNVHRITRRFRPRKSVMGLRFWTSHALLGYVDALRQWTQHNFSFFPIFRQDHKLCHTG